MKVVVDTNIVFSAIVKASGTVAKAFFSVPSFAKYYAPDFLIEELQIHKRKLLKVSGLSEVNYEKAKTSVFASINFIDVASIPEIYSEEAVSLTKDIDFKDFQFVALAIFLDAVLWTGDKKLYNGLRRRGFKSVMSTQQIYSTFGL
jgi:predicted nucleic acid-binding protein